MVKAPETSRQLEELRRVLLKPEALVDRISPVIADILAEQINQSPDEIARAIAPAISEAIRHQVYQAREDVIDALYPVVGQMIARAVSEAVRNLAESIDQRLRQRTSLLLNPRYWQARMQGISHVEYAIRDILPFTIHEIFLIQRDSGLLICHYSAGPERPDRDVISGMLTAIRDFAQEAFGREESGELDAIAYESRRILIERGSAAYLAVVISGVEPSDFCERLRETLFAIHEHRYDRIRMFDGSDTKLIQEARQIVRNTLVPQQRDHAPRRMSASQRAIVVVLGIIAFLPLLLCGAWMWNVEARLAMLAAPVAVPPATATPSPTSTPTSTSMPTLTSTPTSTSTPTPTSTPTSTSTPTPTSTPTSTSTPTPTPSPFNGVMIGNVFLYSTPDEASTRTRIVAPLGAPVEVLAQWSDWYRVRVALPESPQVELIGWVPARWVSLLKPVPPELITPTVTL